MGKDCQMQQSSTPPWQFSLRSLMIVVTIFCVSLGLLMWVVRAAQEEKARLMRLGSNFNALSHALKTYLVVNGQFPAANGVDLSGKPTTSWRLLLAPYLEQSNAAYDVSWNTGMHSQLGTYAFAGYFYNFPGEDAADPPETRIIAITGPGTAFEDGKTYQLEELPSDLIIVVETRNSGFHWMKPGDLDIRTMPRTIDAPDGCGIAANIGRRFHVIFADGTVWQLSTDVPFEDIEKFLTIDGAKQHDRNAVLGPYVTRKWLYIR